MDEPRAGEVLRVDGLSVELATGEPVVEEISLRVDRGELLGIVGESGSGKTTTALAILGFARPGVRIASGTIEIAGERFDARDEKDMRRVRGRLVSYIPQEPGSALNPSLRVGDAVGDMLKAHRPNDAGAAVLAALQRAHLPTQTEFARRFPHQVSGGQLQRVAIAVALVCEPPVVVLDEPTTGLDVVTQARILEEIGRLRREQGVALVYVSHDLAVVSTIADRIAVMYAGRIVEEGPADRVLLAPRHPYTRGLAASIPDHLVPRRLHGMPGVAAGIGERPPGCAFAPRCPQRVGRCEQAMPSLEQVEVGHRVRCFEWARTPPLELGEPARSETGAPDGEPLLSIESLRAVHRTRDGVVTAVDGVSFALAQGECLALVGESGSGKTTVARCIVGLHEPHRGRVLLDGHPLAPHARQRSREERRRCQLVFQNPYESLNPRHRIGDTIGRPARLLRGLSANEARAEAEELLEQVRLPARVADSFPGELSGGERQRVSIARALAAKPDVMVCDEITSALDASVQAATLELLTELRRKLGTALLFISHDLGVVASIADRVLVLEHGIVCEEAPVAQLLRRPQHAYTRQLLEAAPRPPQPPAHSTTCVSGNN